MATVKCKHGKRGRTTHELVGGKDRIYCYGWNDKSTEELCEECKICADNINKTDSDEEKAR